MSSKEQALKSLIKFLNEHADIISTGVLGLAYYIMDRKVDKSKEWLRRKHESQNLSDEDRDDIIDLITSNPDLVAEAVANDQRLYRKVQKLRQQGAS